MDSTQRQARKAGLLYFLLAVTAPIGLEYVPAKLIVLGDATATAERIRGSETLFRIGIASELLHQAVGIFLLLSLYRLFKTVDKQQAVLMVILGSLVSVPVVFANVFNDLAALILLSGAPFLSPFDKPQLDALAYMFLRLHSQGITVASIFWGLWLFPFGTLVIRSGFIPRVLGWLMMIAGVGYLVAAFVAILIPAQAHAVGQVALLFEFGEIPIIFWLLIWGANGPRRADPLPS